MPGDGKPPRGRRFQESGLTFTVPASFDPRRCLPPELDNRRNRETAMWIESTVLRKTAYNGADKNSYVHLHSDVLRRCLPRGYPKVFDALVAAGEFDPPFPYSAGRWSKGYRLSGRRVGDRCKTIPATERGIISRHAREQVRMQQEAEGTWLPVHLDLRENLRPLTLEDRRGQDRDEPP